MNEAIERIHQAFEGKLIGSFQMKIQVCTVVSRMPSDTRDFITKKCWFFSSMEDTWAFAFTGNDLKDMHMVFLSDDLLMQNEAQIHHTIAHEIGHIVLNHRNAIHMKQSTKEIEQQEREADAFAEKFTLDRT